MSETTRAEKYRRLMAGGETKALSNRTRRDEEVLAGVPGELAALLTERRREIAQIRADSRYTEEYRFQALEEARARHAETFWAVREKAQAARERITAAAQEAAAEEPLPTEEALLREMQLQRTWSRYRTLLEGSASVEPETLVTRAAVEGEIAVVALSEELPAYLEGRGFEAAGIEAVRASVDREREPYLSAEQKAGRRLAEEITAGGGPAGSGFCARIGRDGRHVLRPAGHGTARLRRRHDPRPRP